MTSSTSHLHGGNPDSTFERLGIKKREYIDFSVNLNPLGPPEVLRDRWRDLYPEIKKYPSLNGDGVTGYYTGRFQLEAESILPGNGSSECIYLAPRTLGLTKVVIVTPSFHDYERACALAGAELVDLPLSASNDFQEPDYASMTKALQTADAIMLGNPNNPTNTLFSREALLKLADEFPGKHILIDEAFSQFPDDFEDRTLLRKDCLRKNILVFHSMTKFFDIPGIRLGAAVGHPETIQNLRQSKEPWTVNAIAENMAQWLVGCEEYELKLKRTIQAERERIFNDLSRLDGLRLFPSRTNYILSQWTATKNLDDLLRFLLENGIFIRDCRNFRHLEDNYFRFAVLTQSQNTRLIRQIKTCCDRFSNE